MTSHLSSLEPPGRVDCLCGSGVRFKNCCKNEYSKNHFDGWSLFNKGEYKKALKSVRPHITWYRLCHMAHTVPLLKSNSNASKNLLKTDVEALSGMLELLLSCYVKCGIADDYPNALENLKDAISDDRWKLKIDYHNCMYLYIYKNEQKSAKEILERYDWGIINDVDLLTLLLDVNSDSLNQSEIIKIAEKICEISDSPSTKLQYGNLIGIQYCLLNDTEKGIPIIESSIAQYERVPQDNRTCMEGITSQYPIKTWGSLLATMGIC